MTSTSLPLSATSDAITNHASDAIVYANDYALTNSSTRFRPAYKNRYKGWMGVIDGAYNWKPANLKISAAAGYASGDSNPHASNREYDKDYYGFVGVNESYAGKRVKSVLALGARKLQTPLTADPYEKQLFDNSFTDMYYTGAGLVWRCTSRDVECSTNALAFFKDARSFKTKYDSINQTAVFDTAYARRFYGVELNLTIDWKLLPGLNLIGEAAVFVPGTFYQDVRGLPVDGSVVGIMEQEDPTDLMDDTSSFYYNSAVPRLGVDPQVALNVALQYKF